MTSDRLTMGSLYKVIYILICFHMLILKLTFDDQGQNGQTKSNMAVDRVFVS